MTSARGILRNGISGSLATLETKTNHPYASFVALATDTSGNPIFLISTLAWHTRNLETDSRASVLFVEQSSPASDPLDIGRVSLLGMAERVNEPLIRSRFLAKHPSAALYADFADFSFWRLRVERAHFVGGFGRISTLSADEMLIGEPVTRPWDAAIGDLLGQLNQTYSAFFARLAASMGGKSEQSWSIAASDPDGCDLNSGGETVRLTFEHPIFDPYELPGLLKEMAQSS